MIPIDSYKLVLYLIQVQLLYYQLFLQCHMSF